MSEPNPPVQPAPPVPQTPAVQARIGHTAQLAQSAVVTPPHHRSWRERLFRRGPERGTRWAIGLERVSKKFGDVVGVEDVSFAVPEGAIVGVIGPSGAGKTTTIRLMTGALRPDVGLVRVLGDDPRRFSRRTREKIGYMPQLFVLYPDLTVRENVEFMAALFGIPPWRRGRRLAEVLDLVDLTQARDRRASALSGGMQRRLELACALVHQPRLLVLDEPTAGIDPLLRKRIWQELDRLSKSGVTVIVTTQYVSEAEYCDSVVLISEGNLVAFATPQDLRKQALGGEVIEVVTSAPFDASALPPIEGVVSVRQQGPNDLLFVATDAGAATPRVNDAIERAGGAVDSSREYRPTFDEVFSVLVTAHAQRGRGEAGQPGPGLMPHQLARPR